MTKFQWKILFSILDILLLTHFYLPYEKDKSPEEQYQTYKERALVKSKCTPIDILHKTVNITFKGEETVEQIFSKCKYMISKCVESFPDEEERDVVTWLFVLKSMPKQVRTQLAYDCRAPSLDELSTSLQRYASRHNKSFGLANYYRNYVRNYADIACKLYDLVKKSSPKNINWTDEYLYCFENLKSSLSQDIKLYHLDANKPFILQTDASSYAVGAVLGQRLDSDGPVLPIQYISKKLNESQRRYSTIKREAYAVVWAVQKLSFYLLGNHFIIESDHQPLSYLNKNSKSNDKLRRWELMLNNFDYEVSYIAGKDNHMSDYLSRFI